MQKLAKAKVLVSFVLRIMTLKCVYYLKGISLMADGAM